MSGSTAISGMPLPAQVCDHAGTHPFASEFLPLRLPRYALPDYATELPEVRDMQFKHLEDTDTT